jgi:hypothetical protein
VCILSVVTTHTHCLYCTSVYLCRSVSSQHCKCERRIERLSPPPFHAEQLNTCDARQLSHNFCQWITLLHKKGKTTKLFARSQTQQFVFTRDCLRHKSTAFHPNFQLPHSAALWLQIPSEHLIHSSLRSSHQATGCTTDELGFDYRYDNRTLTLQKIHFGSDVQPANYSIFITPGEKRPEHEADNWTPSSPYVKYEWNYTSSPPTHPVSVPTITIPPLHQYTLSLYLPFKPLNHPLVTNAQTIYRSAA